MLAACQGIEAPVIACLGLAYKADVGDLRESPAIAVIERLQKPAPDGFWWSSRTSMTCPPASRPADGRRWSASTRHLVQIGAYTKTDGAELAGYTSRA